MTHSDPLTCVPVDPDVFGGFFDWLVCRSDSSALTGAAAGAGAAAASSPTMKRNSSRTNMTNVSELFADSALTDAADEFNSAGVVYRSTIDHIDVSSVQGHRETMEDYHTVQTNIYGRDDLTAVAVYDGHCGTRASKFCHDVMVDSVIRSAEFLSNLENSLAAAMKQTSNAYTKQAMSHGWADGSTAVVAFIQGNDIVVGNIGDSRAVLGRRNQSTNLLENVDLTKDHKPCDEEELQRIKKAKGWVGKSFAEYQAAKGSSTFRLTPGGGSFKAKPKARNIGLPDRVYPGGLSVARTVGDVFIKQQCPGAITDRPDIFRQRMCPLDELLVLACDGLWDVVSSAEAVALASSAVESGRDAADYLSGVALNRGSRDNITVIVVVLAWEEAQMQSIQSILSSSPPTSPVQTGRRTSSNPPALSLTPPTPTSVRRQQNTSLQRQNSGSRSTSMMRTASGRNLARVPSARSIQPA